MYEVQSTPYTLRKKARSHSIVIVYEIMRAFVCVQMHAFDGVHWTRKRNEAIESSKNEKYSYQNGEKERRKEKWKPKVLYCVVWVCVRTKKYVPVTAFSTKYNNQNVYGILNHKN